MVSDLENEKKTGEELKKEFLLTEIRNEMLIQLVRGSLFKIISILIFSKAVRKNSVYENYAQEIEGQNPV